MLSTLLLQKIHTTLQAQLHIHLRAQEVLRLLVYLLIQYLKVVLILMVQTFYLITKNLLQLKHFIFTKLLTQDLLHIRLMLIAQMILKM